MEYYSTIKRNKIGSFVDMDGGNSVIQNEVSLKNKYRILIYVESRKVA